MIVIAKNLGVQNKDYGLFSVLWFILKHLSFSSTKTFDTRGLSGEKNASIVPYLTGVSLQIPKQFWSKRKTEFNTKLRAEGLRTASPDSWRRHFKLKGAIKDNTLPVISIFRVFKEVFLPHVLFWYRINVQTKIKLSVSVIRLSRKRCSCS